MSQNTHSRWINAATTAAVCVALLLCAVKIAGWFITGSTAILGSLADSCIDLLASVAAALAARFAAIKPDANHKYGHNKAEALFALTQVVLISVSAALVIWESTGRLFSPQPVHAPHIAMGTLVFALIATLTLVTFQTYALKKTDSLIVKSDRAHYLGDVMALAGALAAIFIGETYGIPRLDAIAGLIMGIFLAYAAWQVGKCAIPELMDEELPQQDKLKIVAILKQNKDILGYHALRTRRAGSKRFIQLDIQLSASLSFRQAHKITDDVELALEAAFADTDVIVHADPAGEARLERRGREEVAYKKQIDTE
ncbi:cation diffusion facilitator family transporter [Alteromonas sp. C1M14]|uniref:cation diffusion facilitator family transporter n=1 Tax=Alteromonas sp. C1M14 TaxID=2841567 RepID=UPI001C0A239E|nr:cation diffusion facilitator family transporter [Alteromonas sp. C1M14]